MPYPAPGVTVKEAKKRLKKLRGAESRALGNQELTQQVRAEKVRIVTERRTGFAWVLLRK